MTRFLSFGLLVLSFGCRPTIPEGRFICELDQDCPPTMRCAPDSRCWTRWPSADGAAYEDGGPIVADAGDETDSGPVPDADAGPGVDAGHDAGAPDGGPPLPPCSFTGPIEEYVWSDGGVYCGDGEGGVFLGRDDGNPPPPWRGVSVSACARWNLPDDRVTGVAVRLEAAPTVCGSATCEAEFCGTGRSVEVFDNERHVGTFGIEVPVEHVFAVRGAVIVCRDGGSFYRDQVHVVSVSCL